MHEVPQPVRQLPVCAQQGEHLVATGSGLDVQAAGADRLLDPAAYRERHHAEVAFEGPNLLRGFWTLSHDVARTG